MLVDVVVDVDENGKDIQYGVLRYKDKTYKEILRTNIYEFIDEDKLPYIYFEGEIIYIADMHDVIE